MFLARLVIGFNAVVLGSFGVFGLVAPEQLAELAGWTIMRSDGIVEISATYGGLEFGAALLCLYTLTNPRRLRWGLIFSLALVGGLAIGRTAGLLHYGVHGMEQLISVCVEWAFTGLAIYALQSEELDYYVTR